MLSDELLVSGECVVESPALPIALPQDGPWESLEEMESALLSKEQREQRRLARRPSIDHLADAVGTLPNGDKIALFDVGDRIVVERNLLWSLNTWLDTRVYLVREIDDETGVVKCTDEEMQHHATVGFKHPGQLFKLCPSKGNPFTQGAVRAAQKAAKEAASATPGDPSKPEEKRRRGRPKGAKNRPRDEIKAEKEARKADRAEKRARRKRK